MDATTTDTMILRALQLASDELALGDLQTCKSHMHAKVRMVRMKGGASAGIGIETARAMAATGARVVLVVRSLEKFQQGCSDLLDPGWFELIKCDTSSLSSVREAAESFLSKSQTLNILVCNAGCHGRTAA
ncbi:WW domain-containing oxidoreductase 3 [Seiridium cupressi]